MAARAAAAPAEQSRQLAAGPKQENPNAAFSKTQRGRNLAMIGAFDIRQPHQLTLLPVELCEHARHVETQRNIGGGRAARGGRFVRSSSLVAPAAPVIDDQVAGAWAKLRLLLRDSGLRMHVNDSWIAATAMSLGVPVVTRDEDYVQLPGLTVIKV